MNRNFLYCCPPTVSCVGTFEDYQKKFPTAVEISMLDSFNLTFLVVVDVDFELSRSTSFTVLNGPSAFHTFVISSFLAASTFCPPP
jgi:hypothetical protein